MHPKLSALLGDEVVKEREAAAIIGIPLFELQKLRRDGRGPAYTHVARKLRFYRLSDIAAWLNAKYVRPAAVCMDQEASAA